MKKNHGNAMAIESLKKGQPHTAAGANYVGSNPVFAEIYDPFTKLKTWQKVRKGLPFIKVS